MKYGGETVGFHLAAGKDASHCSQPLSSEYSWSEYHRDGDLSSNSCGKLDRRPSTQDSKLPEDSDPAGPAYGPTRSDGRFKGDVMANRSRKEHSSLHVPRGKGDTVHLLDVSVVTAACLHGNEDFCRSEELSDIINFLIETDPKRSGGGDDYASSVSFLDADVTEPRGSPDSGKEGHKLEDLEEGSSSGSLYDFSYEAAMTHNCNARQCDQRDECCNASSFQGERVKGSPRDVEDDRCKSPSTEDQQLSHVPSSESLVSSSDSEGRLVIDESPDVTVLDNGILATPYRYHGSLCEGDCSGDTTLSAARGIVCDTEGDLSSHVDVQPDEPLTDADETNCKRCTSDVDVTSFETRNSEVPRGSEGAGDIQRAHNIGEFVCVPCNISRTTSGSALQRSDVLVEPDTDDATERSTEGGGRTPGVQCNHNAETKRERFQSRRYRRSHSADSLRSAQRSNILSVYTTVRDGRIVSVDCKRYRKRPRRSFSKDRDQVDVVTAHVGNTDAYDEVVNAVVRDMVDTAVKNTEVTPDKVTGAGLKHHLRSFCETKGCHYEDFVSDDAVPTSGVYQIGKESERVGAPVAKRVARKAPPVHRTRSRKRRRKSSPAPGKTIVTRSQWKKKCYEQFLREMDARDMSGDVALPKLRVKRRRRASFASSKSSNASAEPSADLSGASLEIDGEARRFSKDDILADASPQTVNDATSQEVLSRHAESEGTKVDDRQGKPVDDSETEELDEDMLEGEDQRSNSPCANDVAMHSSVSGQKSQASNGASNEGPAVEDPGMGHGDGEVVQGAAMKCSVKQEPVQDTDGARNEEVHSKDVVHRARDSEFVGVSIPGIEQCPVDEPSPDLLEQGASASVDRNTVLTDTVPVTWTESSSPWTPDAQDDSGCTTGPEVKREIPVELSEDGGLDVEDQGEPLNLSTKDNLVQRTRTEVPVGTVLPQVAATGDSTDPPGVCNAFEENGGHLNYSHNIPKSQEKNGLEPGHADGDRGMDGSTEPTPGRGSSESILQRLLLESSKSSKAVEYESPMPVIVDVRSMQDGMSNGVTDPARSEQVISGRLEHSTRLPGVSKASASIPPMSFPENGLTTLESKIIELKKQIHHLTILATYKEKELGCIRSLRLAKEEALRHLECKYPSMFASRVTNSELDPLARPDKYSNASSPGTVAPELAVTSDKRPSEIEKLRIAREEVVALAGLCSSNAQNSGVDSFRGPSTFRNAAPKQRAAIEDSAGPREPSAGPFWLRDASPRSFPMPRSPKSFRLLSELASAKTAFQGSVSSAPQLCAMPPLWHTRALNGADSHYPCSDTSRDSSLSPRSSASLTASPVLSQTFSPGATQPSAGHSTRYPFAFANLPHSITSELGDIVLGSSPLSKTERDNSSSASSNIFSPLPTLYSHEDLLSAEAEQQHALNAYAQLLRSNRDIIPPELAAALRDRQGTAGFSSSQTGGLFSAVNSWMEHARTSQRLAGGICSSAPGNHSRYGENRLKVPHSRHPFGDEGSPGWRKAVQGGVVCVNCGDPRVKYVCSCCRTQTFCSEQCQMQLWSEQNQRAKKT